MKTSSDFLIIQGTIGNFVNEEGDVVDESYLLSSSDTQPLVCPYHTKLFCVYKLDFSKNIIGKGGVFEGSSCVFGWKSIDVIVQS